MEPRSSCWGSSRRRSIGRSNRLSLGQGDGPGAWLEWRGVRPRHRGLHEAPGPDQVLAVTAQDRSDLVRLLSRARPLPAAGRGGSPAVLSPLGPAQARPCRLTGACRRHGSGSSPHATVPRAARHAGDQRASRRTAESGSGRVHASGHRPSGGDGCPNRVPRQRWVSDRETSCGAPWLAYRTGP